MVAHSLHCLGATACRCLEGDADQPLADALRTVRLIDDQGVNSDEVPRPLELPPSGDSYETDNVSIRLGDDNLSRR